MKTKLLLTVGLAVLLPQMLHAFCGFYVARADAKLYNKSSQVCLVRDGNKTVLTMANDYQGDPKEFAMVIPVPTVIDKQQVRVVEKALMDEMDAYAAPRLVEYWDDDPCTKYYPPVPVMAPEASGVKMKRVDGARSLGVKVLREFAVGEYDIVVLSAKESDGLVTWLNENEYRIPDGAEGVLQSYIKQQIKFFVAKVNLDRQAKAGRTWLRPIQVSYSTRKFMLPIRLGTVNADGAQDLIIHCLTRNGRVETTNYRTVRLPTDEDIPEYVKKDFGAFYRAMFERAVAVENQRAVFTEYFWDMGWCDPCAADPLPNGKLRELGALWLNAEAEARPLETEVFVTRLHVRYDRETFPEDLVFQETGDKKFLQGRYVMRHPWVGKADCEEGKAYFQALPQRRDAEAKNLARLTGWDITVIRREMDKYREPAQPRR
jgi:hypothetical protein